MTFRLFFPPNIEAFFWINFQSWTTINLHHLSVWTNFDFSLTFFGIVYWSQSTKWSLHPETLLHIFQSQEIFQLNIFLHFLKKKYMKYKVERGSLQIFYWILIFAKACGICETLQRDLLQIYMSSFQGGMDLLKNVKIQSVHFVFYFIPYFIVYTSKRWKYYNDVCGNLDFDSETLQDIIQNEDPFLV